MPNVANTVASMQRDFQTCFERQLDRDPTLKGTVLVEATIGSSGEVKAIKSTPKGLNGAIVTCVEARIRAAQFAPPDGGPEATIRLPLTFVPDPAPSSTPPPKR